MARLGRLIALLMLPALGACAIARPEGPSILALPGKGRDAARFAADEQQCRSQAAAQIDPDASARATDSAVGTAAVGTALGAAAGALIGSASGNVGAGALIGGGAGLAAGSVIGAQGAGASAGQLQYRYDNAYAQCIAASGNTVVLNPAPAYPVPAYGPYPYAYGYPYAYPYAFGGVAVLGYRRPFYHHHGYRGGWRGRR